MLDAETHLISVPVTLQVRDAVAVIQFLMWLEKAVPGGNQTELSALEYVNQRRKWVQFMHRGTDDMKYLNPTILL